MKEGNLCVQIALASSCLCPSTATTLVQYRARRSGYLGDRTWYRSTASASSRYGRCGSTWYHHTHTSELAPCTIIPTST
eukprot:3940507-Rhodomonas_salina.4